MPSREVRDAETWHVVRAWVTLGNLVNEVNQNTGEGVAEGCSEEAEDSLFKDSQLKVSLQNSWGDWRRH